MEIKHLWKILNPPKSSFLFNLFPSCMNLLEYKNRKESFCVNSEEILAVTF